MTSDTQKTPSSFRGGIYRLPEDRSQRIHAFTLVEVMIAMLVLSMVMLGFLGTFIQSRRVTESAVLHAAATSLVYGIIEQLKELDYTSSLPSLQTDPSENPTPASRTQPPLVRIRVDQTTMKWLRVVYTPANSDGTAAASKAPTSTPAPDALPADVGAAPGATDNAIGALPLSTVTGTASQSINLHLWIWIDEIPDPTHDVNQVKQVTVVYTYTFVDGGKIRSIRDRAVFLRTRYEQ